MKVIIKSELLGRLEDATHFWYRLLFHCTTGRHYWVARLESPTRVLKLCGVCRKMEVTVK